MTPATTAASEGHQALLLRARRRPCSTCPGSFPPVQLPQLALDDLLHVRAAVAELLRERRPLAAVRDRVEELGDLLALGPRGLGGTWP
eukprot:CAMPEP_0179293386 /NCGR_PEP_ID=MMETSP0797-20121207/43347_1 /TAXON_ID=47934 /ORGANISM="Dinophysis acuminata, Strain DAEP01" /LENGTH=87 /DNA_ID=CAMNT_0021002533 /DNA_START=344 /DNA_END=603 /DNA_ORIENTATION=+